MAIVAMLTDIKDVFASSTSSYRVTYSVQSGVKSLAAGSQVRVGGLPLGKVTGVRFDDASTTPNIIVDFELPSHVELRTNARIVVVAALVGAGAWLDVTELGTEPAPMLADGDTLAGAESAGLLSDLLGPNAPMMIDDAKEFLALLGRIDEDYDGYVLPMLEDFRMMVRDASQVRYPSWADSVDRIMARAESAMNRADEMVVDAQGAVRDVRSPIDENRPKVKRVVENVEAASERIDPVVTQVEQIADDVATMSAELRARQPELVDSAERVLQRGQDALDESIALVERVQQDYEGWSTDFNEVMGNASLASQQIKLATIEVRRSPWKLLFRPGADELDHELLYEAARSFALGVTDLKTTTLATERLLDQHGDRLLADDAAMKRVRDNLLNSIDRYEAAQNQLFDILLDDSPTR